ncbi:MAG: DUF3343 domain-containing protein [Syntrophomonadaceae bacterium]|nr:DUF3343 domain-containing protein [Syntrophomonadaceae bacterium]
MDNSLIKTNNYTVFTFTSTSNALKAEKLLKEIKAEFLIMPTLREISSSCGLSIKLASENQPVYYQYLIDHNVDIDGAYNVEKQGKKNLVTKARL